jgi:flagellar protein FlaG
MEVRSIGQGGQVKLETGNVSEKNAQISNNGASEKIKVDDNRNIGNKDIKEKDLRDAVDKLNKFLEDNGTRAEYEYHDKLKHDLMIRIVDVKSGEVVQEVPPRKILDMVAKMMEMVGVLFDKKA